MATITGLTADRMLEIEAASVVDGDVVGNDLFLTKHDGTIINAGNVRGPVGPDGPMGHSVAVLTAQQILDVGAVGQIRAGRPLTPADFTAMDLSVPLGLWPLGSTADISGAGRNLTNKGAIPFGVGIMGAPASAAVFAGSTAQALYIADTGSADPFRIKGGTFGLWFKTAKRGTGQVLIGKWDDTIAGRRGWNIAVDSSVNSARFSTSNDGGIATAFGVSGWTDICDDRWHFVVAVFDVGVMKIYIDGVMENFATGSPLNLPLFGTPAPFNIGSNNADAAVAAQLPSYGRHANAFVTDEVLSDDQIRNLMCASIPHALGEVPAQVTLKVRRKKRGAPLATTDFPSQPVRLYNFQNGSLADQGSANIPISNLSPSLIIPTSGPDGKRNQAFHLAGAHIGLGANDSGLPSGLSPRSFGVWVKSEATNIPGLIGWGNGGSSGAGAMMGMTTGTVYVQSGGVVNSGIIVNDGQWHFCVSVEDNTAPDGLKIKLYVDGELVAAGTTMGSIVLGGANRFRMGAYPDSTVPLVGQLARGFVFPGVLTIEQVRKLYNVGGQELPPSPKDAADHIETIEAARMLVMFDGLESHNSIDLAVLA